MVIELVKKIDFVYLSMFDILATFCALYTMKEQIENEGIVNVYELAKFYHNKRPGIWRHSVRKILFLMKYNRYFL